MQILIVEDDLDILEILLEEFQISGHRVDGAIDFQSAMTLLRANKYELIVSDYNIPKGSGLEILEYIKTLSERPFFFMISAEVELEINDLLKLGVDRFYTKPFDFEKILLDIDVISNKLLQKN